jgi:hypothetical protein
VAQARRNRNRLPALHFLTNDARIKSLGENIQYRAADRVGSNILSAAGRLLSNLIVSLTVSPVCAALRAYVLGLACLLRIAGLPSPSTRGAKDWKMTPARQLKCQRQQLSAKVQQNTPYSDSGHQMDIRTEV